MTNKSRLLSGKVLTSNSANVSPSRYQFLDLSSAEPNLGTGNTGDVLTFNSSYPGGRRWIPQAEIAGSIGQSAYIEANTASANTLYLSGVDLAQNNSITIIQGVDVGQNARMVIIEGTDASQNVRLDFSNTRMAISDGVDVTQNAAIAATNQYATSAFSTANNAYTKANNALANTTGTFAGTLTVTGNVIANSFTTSGSSGNISGVNFVYANTFVSSNAYIFPDGTIQTTAATGIDSYARTTANTNATNITIIQGVDLWQNTQITAASALAQGAFARANSGARATSSNTTPTGNTVGDLWLSLTDETLYMYSYDGVSNNWVDISGPILRSSNIFVQYTITANVS